MCPKSTKDGTNDKQNWRCGSSIALRIPLQRREKLCIHKQITVDTGQHHTRQAPVRKHTACDSLASGLKGYQRDRNGNPARHWSRCSGQWTKRHHESSDDYEQVLQRVGRHQDPAFAPAKVPVVTGKEKRSETEKGD